MTRHLLSLIRIAGLSYRLLLLFLQYLERFPLERFVVAVELFIRWAETQAATSTSIPSTEGVATADDRFEAQYDESELMTIKDGEDYFGRTKLYELRKAGKLTTVAFHARDKRLVRAEVVALARWRRR